jgi:thiopeptide-type bacteriocin biosynthesis protein
MLTTHGTDRRPRQILHTHLAHHDQATLRDDQPDDADGWLGRPAEIVVPMTVMSPQARRPPTMAAPGTTHRPGMGPVICARLTGNPARFDDVIAALPAFAARLNGSAQRWWLRRYRDLIRPDAPQHVAMYIRLAGDVDFGHVSAQLAAFADGLEERGLPSTLNLTPYYERPGQYGHGAALAAAEQAWAADTIAAVAQLAMVAAGTPAQAITAASMTRVAFAFASTTGGGYEALTRCLPQGSGPLDREVRELACALSDPAGGPAALHRLPRGDAVAEAWSLRDAALTAYCQRLSSQRDPATVLRTLLHEHHMRAIGLDPNVERQTGRYARAAALRHLALVGSR